MITSEKTVLLDGTEQFVEISGMHCDIRNDSTETIYASRYPNITANADGVISIPAGRAIKLFGCDGTVYLKGTGSVQLCGSDFTDRVFLY